MVQKINKYATTNTLVLLGIVLGFLFGSFLPELALKQELIGQIFISLLKMLVVPLVFSSIFIAILGLGSVERLKSIGIRTIALYVLTTALAVLLAIVAMNIFPVGEAVSSDGLVFEKASQITPFSFSSMILSFIPTNIFKSLSDGAMMPIIVFSIFLGVASLHLKEEKQKSMFELFRGVSDAILVMAEWIIRLTPIGVFSLLSYVVADQGIHVIIGFWK